MAEPPTTVDATENPENHPGDATQPSDEILAALHAVNTETHGPTVEQQPSQTSQNELPPSEYELVKQHLKDNPQDNDQWRRLIDIAEESEDVERIKETYDLLLEQFPNNSSAQLSYLQHFSTDPQYSQTLFTRFLWSSPSVDLWTFYLTYVRRVNVGPAARGVIQKSYEFALAHIGHDKDSGSIWSDYIEFLKAGETSSTWEEQQKMDALRKVYHRAVQIPLDNVERLWQDLEAFEISLNRITAKKFMADLSPSHMQARTVLRQLQKHLGPLFPPLAPSSRRPLYLPSPPSFSPPDRALVGAWKAYLKWEESNPLEIEEKDKASLITRIQSVYRKAVIRMRYYSEIWFMAYSWTASVGKDDEALSILKAGLKANPSSPLLNFAYAEVLEAKGDVKAVHEVYGQLLTLLQKALESLEAANKVPNSPTSPSGDAQNASTVGNGVPGLSDAGLNSNNSSFSTDDSKPPNVKEMNERRSEYGVVYIMYMRFARRAEEIKSARAVFQRARKDRWVPWEVYDASALMEYHCSHQTDVSLRIYEKGLELFGSEVEFVHRYLTFLISINDDNNARALFERVIGNLPADRARPLWERWARYEYQYGELEAVQKLEKRIAEVYPNDPSMKRFAQKYMYHGVDVIAVRDLGFSVSRSSSSGQQQTARTETSFATPNVSTSTANISSQPSSGSGHKRASSPDHRKGRDDGPGRGGDYGPGSKRQRPISPPPRDRDRDGGGGRDRWDGPPRRRHSPPPDRDVRGRDRDREDDKPLLPHVIPWFLGQLPAPSHFDGPVFRTDDLITLFRNAVIPSTGRARSPPPVPPPRGGGRPPPDYSPYTGPGGGRSGGRRY
ncbi:mRNA 3'-end-processing protein rna14 [Pleurotus ostreatus]|nr:mRNA 3'-end-processing protein rna14 [Pleurotus ostreatus]